jgi:hypothetical protein
MRLLFLVHGMGANPPGWSKPIQARLDELAARYTYFAGGKPFTQRLRIVEIGYDSVFSDLVEHWQDDLEEFRKLEKSEALKLPEVLRTLSQATLPEEVKSVFWTTLIDPVLYRGVSIVRDKVRALVQKQLLEALEPEMAKGPVPACVVCHSLGTIVTHDALDNLGSVPQSDGHGGQSRAFMPPAFTFDTLFSLANVSRLGPYDRDPYNTCVRPLSAGDAGGGVPPYLKTMYSFHHRWDPFTLFQTFHRDDWGPDYVEPAPLEHVHSANVHGFLHYLDHPTVHVPILNKALGTIAIPKRERDAKLLAYPPIQPAACGVAIQKLKDRAEQLAGSVKDSRNMNQVIQAGIWFYMAAREAANSCPELLKGFEGD